MWNLVPQVFHDFLARVIPGATLIAVTVIVVFGPAAAADFMMDSPKLNRLFGTGPLLLGVLVSYLLGFLSGQFWEMTIGRLTRRTDGEVEARCQRERLAEHNRLQKALKRPELSIDPGDLPRVFVMRDHLRRIVPGEASRLLEVRAERRMCQVLVLGFSVLRWCEWLWGFSCFWRLSPAGMEQARCTGTWRAVQRSRGSFTLREARTPLRRLRADCQQYQCLT
jgi:hypothetical protein